MAINFPDSPTNGQQISAGGNTWQYNSTKSVWEKTLTSGRSSGGTTTYATISDLPLSGVNAGQQAFVSGSNRLYISNGTGWYSVSLVNTNPAITSVEDASAGITPFTLATDGTATVITITAADPEGIPLTYNYAVTTGSLTNGGGTTATVVQGTGANTNQFTITPTSTEAYAGTFELTFTATDGINQASSANSFTLEFITIIDDSNHTTLLATAVDTSDNNNITDASSNNYTITVNGDAYAGTFSPYRSGGYSTYFDGAGDYIDTGLNNVATDFTFECWVNTTVGGMLMARYQSGSALDGFLIDLTSGFPIIQINTNTNNLIGTVNLKDGKWHYLAFVRDNNVCKIFVDGILDVSQTDSEAMQVNANWIIGRHGNNASYYYGGYIRDLRWVAGTARYTGNFTPPTEPLTTLSGDNLFTCHLPYIIDGSATPYTMTSYGNTSTKPFSPYDYEEYTVAASGGSVFFDGNPDHLQGPSVDLIGSGAFTVECWGYILSTITSSTDAFLAQYQTNNKFILGVKADVVRVWMAAVEVRVGTTNITNNGWHHFALVRDSNNSCQLYIDGNEEGAAFTNSTDFSTSLENFQIGSWDGGNNSDLHGYISDLRVVKGTAVYTSAFTPPTAPLSTISGTTLHIKGTDASIIDTSQVGNLELVETTGSTTRVKFTNTKSIYTGGNSQAKIRLDESNPIYNLSYGQGDFTIEGWFWATDNTNNPKLYMDAVSASTYWQLYYLSGTGITLRANNTGIYSIETGDSFTENTWHHIALCRAGSNYKVFHNGTEIINVNSTHQIGNNSQKTIGGTDLNSGNNLRGHIQDFRISKGLARYTTNFTPPSAPLEG